jgi:transposase
VAKRRARPARFLELIAPQTSGGRPCVIEIEGQRGKLRIELNGSTSRWPRSAGRCGRGSPDSDHSQLRILVAIEAIDGRKGIDSLAQLCREKLDADPFSGCLFLFRSQSANAIRILACDGQGFWAASKRLRAHQAQMLLAAGDPDAAAEAGLATPRATMVADAVARTCSADPDCNRTNAPDPVDVPR